MSNGTQTGTIETWMREILDPEPSYFLVDVRIKPINNIKVFVDGDEGIAIEKCVRFNRILYKKIEEAGMFPEGDFSLELSSPGLGEPLKFFRQYKKNIGRKIEVVLTDDSCKEGRLLEVTEDAILIEESIAKTDSGKQVSKKQELINHTFLFTNIKSTKILVVF